MVARGLRHTGAHLLESITTQLGSCGIVKLHGVIAGRGQLNLRFAGADPRAAADRVFEKVVYVPISADQAGSFLRLY